ncbi:proline dehydrogenase [Oceanobacillus oncorhynchi subsp. incaldanensis]|uniref:proline dehydrogenase family protein n=1 Tax=Oceanobacillus oncorhynchi TaxID=545501 RepID=UPI001B1CCF05|nr:proline dehydrogenase family protein [Oceanobacillus oncorhynchi]GIO16944.1 proline dehydrogenase [Oceanobacillus oncorhynchi subsp. incaldanensis]
MANLARNFFIGLSNNDFLNKSARKFGTRFGAERFVAGTVFDAIVPVIRELNQKQISCTMDHLGEFVTDRNEAVHAKEKIIAMLRQIKEEHLDCHISIKLTQLGLDIEESFCIENVEQILDVAHACDIFVNIDMEKYIHYEKTLEILKSLRKSYTNVGTVIQTYLLDAEKDLSGLEDVRLRIVKGAYKEDSTVAYSSKEDIDKNFLMIAKKRLLGKAFTSIATHDHRIIQELKEFIEEHHIAKDRFEFQMLYGFRVDMQHQLVKEGFRFCTYIPFGEDWFGYFMRRLAERPQNLNLLMKDVFYTEEDKLKKQPIIIGTAALTLLLFLGRRRKKEQNN